VEVEPLVIDVGLNDAVQVGIGTTVTVAVHVFVPPAPLSTVSVHVWVIEGDLEEEPLAPEAVPLPRLPVQL